MVRTDHRRHQNQLQQRRREPLEVRILAFSVHEEIERCVSEVQEISETREELGGQNKHVAYVVVTEIIVDTPEKRES